MGREQQLRGLELLICDECEHELKYHADKYGCEVERRDGYVGNSECLQAMGPCGCNGMDEDQVVISAIRRERESRSKAAVALGSIKSDKKALSSRENGKLGGRPKLYDATLNGKPVKVTIPEE